MANTGIESTSPLESLIGTNFETGQPHVGCQSVQLCQVLPAFGFHYVQSGCWRWREFMNLEVRGDLWVPRANPVQLRKCFHQDLLDYLQITPKTNWFCILWKPDDFGMTLKRALQVIDWHWMDVIRIDQYFYVLDYQTREKERKERNAKLLESLNQNPQFRRRKR